MAGLQETHWFGQPIYSVGDLVVVSSGRPLPTDKGTFWHSEGVAVVLCGSALEAWKTSASNSILRAAPVWLTTILCNSPASCS